MPLPHPLTTERLVLRPWRPGDAAALLPVLEANQAHLGPWIPRHVSAVAPLDALAERLAGYAARFEEDREWRYALLTRPTAAAPVETSADGEEVLLGEVSLFPRDASARVALDASDRAEIGYWLRQDWTGRGVVTEAVCAVIALAGTIPRFGRLEIRCDARNAPSAAVPQRLGFALTHSARAPGVDAGGAGVELQTWTLVLGASPDAASALPPIPQS